MRIPDDAALRISRGNALVIGVIVLLVAGTVMLNLCAMFLPGCLI